MAARGLRRDSSRYVDYVTTALAFLAGVVMMSAVAWIRIADWLSSTAWAAWIVDVIA